MKTSQAEGIIQYQLDFITADPVDYPVIAEINAWRRILHQLKLVGQDDGLYQGMGFGNVSCRLNNSHQFVITASQTGHIAELESSHYCVVTDCSVERNRLVARGPMKPSSEALTHAAVYQALPEIQTVIHAHNAMIWQQAEKLHIPSTLPGIACGTVEMAAEIGRLCQNNKTRQRRIFSMAGHEDGIITFGKTAAEAGTTLISYLAAADVKG